MKKTHYEQIIRTYAGERKWAEQVIQKMLDEVGPMPELPEIPVEAAVMYVHKNLKQLLVDRYEKKLMHRIKPVGQMGDRVIGEVNLTSEEFARPALSLIMSVIDRVIDHLLSNQEYPFSYGEIANNPSYHRMFNYCQDHLLHGSFVTQAIVIYHMLSHERAGKRVYSPSDGLAWKLSHTELRGLKTDDLRLPYENVYLEVPETADLKIYNEETGWHRCVGMYITEDKYPYAPNAPDIEPNDREPILGFRSWRIMAVGHSKGFIDHGAGMVEIDDALSYFRIPLFPGETLEAMVKAADAEMEKSKKVAANQGWEHMDEEWKKLFRWAMNAMLYATWTEPGEDWIANREARQLWQRVQKLHGKKSKKLGKLQKRLRGLDPQKRILLGRKVVIDRHIMREGSPGNGNGQPLLVRTRVSGHWKQQPHGPGNKLRKLIWREPYWRGPKDGPITAPTHEMK